MNIIKSLSRSATLFSALRARLVIAMPSGHNFNFYEHKMQKYQTKGSQGVGWLAVGCSTFRSATALEDGAQLRTFNFTSARCNKTRH